MRLSSKNRLHAALDATLARLEALGSHIRQAGAMEPAKVAVAPAHTLSEEFTGGVLASDGNYYSFSGYRELVAIGKARPIGSHPHRIWPHLRDSELES